MRWVDNGREALDEVDAATADVVILDLALPDMDGLDVCRERSATTATRARS